MTEDQYTDLVNRVPPGCRWLYLPCPEAYRPADYAAPENFPEWCVRADVVGVRHNSVGDGRYSGVGSVRNYFPEQVSLTWRRGGSYVIRIQNWIALPLTITSISFFLLEKKRVRGYKAPLAGEIYQLIDPPYTVFRWINGKPMDLLTRSIIQLPIIPKVVIRRSPVRQASA